jgi:hypothetical protein
MKTVKLNINIIIYKRLINLSYGSIFRVLSFYFFCMYLQMFRRVLYYSSFLLNFIKEIIKSTKIPRNWQWALEVMPKLRHVREFPNLFGLNNFRPRESGGKTFWAARLNYAALLKHGVIKPQNVYFRSIKKDVYSNARIMNLNQAQIEILDFNIQKVGFDRHKSFSYGFQEHEIGLVSHEYLGNGRNEIIVYTTGSSSNSIRFDDYNTFDKELLNANSRYSPTGELYLPKVLYVFNLSDEEFEDFVSRVSDDETLDYYAIDQEVLKSAGQIYYKGENKEAKIPESFEDVCRYASLLKTFSEESKNFEDLNIEGQNYKLPKKSNGNGGPEL